MIKKIVIDNPSMGYGYGCGYGDGNGLAANYYIPGMGWGGDDDFAMSTSGYMYCGDGSGHADGYGRDDGTSEDGTLVNVPTAEDLNKCFNPTCEVCGEGRPGYNASWGIEPEEYYDD